MGKTIFIVVVLLIAGCSSFSPTSDESGTDVPLAIEVESTIPPTVGSESTEVPTEVAASVTREPTYTPEMTDGVEIPSVEMDGSAETLDHNQLLGQLLLQVRTPEEAQEILKVIEASEDTRFVAGLIDILRWQRAAIPQINATLNSLTSADSENLDWHDWVEWAGQHPEIESFEDYDLWKSSLFSLIDPNFSRFIYPGVAVAAGSRLEEIVWGGVRVDGIPALDNPTMIDPQEADYLVPHERVFGVSINGDTRAYPARFLDWHEMFNDVVGDTPISLAY